MLSKCWHCQNLLGFLSIYRTPRTIAQFCIKAGFHWNRMLVILIQCNDSASIREHLKTTPKVGGALLGQALSTFEFHFRFK